MKKIEKISNFINTGLKEFSLYTLTSRGIPNFYDSLTPIQRLILVKSPISIEKTPTVIGEVMKQYHHGDRSVIGAINKLARPFGCSEEILIGDGYFGTQIVPNAAAPRYTNIKINRMIYDIINECKFLNTKKLDDTLNPLNVKFPIALLTTTVGIAIGYKTQILPRKYSDIQKALEGKKTSLMPYFKDFSGKITKIKNEESSFLLEGITEVNKKWKTIRITDIPPILNYSQFVDRLTKVLDSYKVSIKNNSKSKVDILLEFKEELTDEIEERVINTTKLVFRESIIFVKDNKVLRYDNLSDYISDFKNKNLQLDLEIMKYDLGNLNELEEYLRAKLEFLKYMLAKKRTSKEVLDFLSKYSDKISSKLDNIKLRTLTPEEIESVEEEIKTTNTNISNKLKDIEKIQNEIENTDFTLKNTKIPLLDNYNSSDWEFDAEEFMEENIEEEEEDGDDVL